VRRVVLSGEGDRVGVLDEELTWPAAQQAHGGFRIVLWRSDEPGSHSQFVLIKWPAGTRIDWHWSPPVDYVYVIEGELECLTMGGVSLLLKAGDVVVNRGVERVWSTPPDSHVIVLATSALGNADWALRSSGSDLR
jgi:quercetin dioxygenase-like cupin family protein